MPHNMDKKNRERKGKENVLRESEEIEGIVIKGYDFNKGVNYSELIKSFSGMGFQASHLSRAIDIVNKMISDKAFIFLGYTSNLVSSGLRDVFRYLVEHKKVNVIVTTAGGIEEDIIKCLGNFILGDFNVDGRELRKRGINRIGNVYAPNNRYVEFEEFIQPLLQEIYEEQRKTGKVICGSELIWKLGERINNKESICYWAWKNKIRIYCPALTDGALGDNIYFFALNKDFGKIFKQKDNSDFKIDIVKDIKELNNTTIGLKKSGVIILGTGVVKHSILNANMLRNGCEYAVYINTSQEYDGSDAGALPDEAISWGKILPLAESVKVFGDATILFPLIVAKSFAREEEENGKRGMF